MKGGSANKISKSKGPSKTFSNASRNSKSKQLVARNRKFQHLPKSMRNDSQVKSSSSEDSDSSDSSDSTSESEIEIKFELFNMAESDYHSIKQYLGSLFGIGEHGVDLVSLTSFIVEALADHLGTCIKTDGEASDPFGFITGFPLKMVDKIPQICESLQNFLLNKGRDSVLNSFFQDSENIIVFQERLINVPASIAGPLYQQFIDDWKMAESEEKSLFVSSKSDAKVLLITPTYKEVISDLDRELGLRENPKNFTSVSTGINYYYEEAEYLQEYSYKTIDFSVQTGHETSDSRRAFSENGIEPGRRIFLLTWSQFIKFVECLQGL